MSRPFLDDLPTEDALQAIKQPLDSDHRARMGITIDPFVFLATLVGAILLFAIAYLILAAP